MSGEIKFGEIDLSEIEYRNEYRYTKAVFTAAALCTWQFGNFVKMAFSAPSSTPARN